MKRFIILLLLVLSINAFADTKYIKDDSFNDISKFSLSNITLVENMGFELSRNYRELFSSGNLLWCMTELTPGKDDFLIGTGGIANIVYVSRITNYIVYTESNSILTSDIKVSGNSIYASFFSPSSVVQFDKSFNIQNKFDITNKYIWQILPYNEGLIILAGGPAEIYTLVKDRLVSVDKLPEEKNITKGSISGDTLYFITDGRTMYSYPLDSRQPKIKGFMEFAEPIKDFTIESNVIYLITSSVDNKSGQSKNNTDYSIEPLIDYSDKAKQPPRERSALYKLDLDGMLSEEFAVEKISFISLSKAGDSIIIGTGQNGSYFEITPEKNLKKYASFGSGTVMKFISTANNSYVLLSEPNRLITFMEGYVKSGELISITYDTMSFAKWGVPSMKADILGNTQVKLYTKSGSVRDKNMWGGWDAAETNKIVQSPVGRFLQYKVELISRGDVSPFVYGINVPFVQFNVVPRIENIETIQTDKSVIIKWTAADGNNDKLYYDIYFESLAGQNGGTWVKINADNKIYFSEIEVFKTDLPEGDYRIKIVAIDEKGASSYRVSKVFTLDSTPPLIGDITYTKKNNKYNISFDVTENTSYLQRITYLINGQNEVDFVPKDGILDQKKESFTLNLVINSPTFFEINAMDTSSNIASKGVLLK